MVLAEVPVRLLREDRVQVVAVFAQQRELVLAAAATLDLAGVGEQQPRLTDQVERDIREPQVLLDRRRVPDPFAQALSEHQARVRRAAADSAARPGRPHRRRRAHKVLTSSGMS